MAKCDQCKYSGRCFDDEKLFFLLLRETKGTVVNVGSISGRIASPYLAPYAVSKFSVRAFSDSLRREMRNFGVKVILVEPGPIKTPIWEKSMDHSSDLKKHLTPELSQIYERPLNGLISAVEEVAKNAVPVSWVTEKVVSAVHSEDPNAYYLIGRGIHFQAFLAKHLPVRWLDAVLSMGYRFQRGKKKS